MQIGLGGKTMTKFATLLYRLNILKKRKSYNKKHNKNYLEKNNNEVESLKENPKRKN